MKCAAIFKYHGYINKSFVCERRLIAQVACWSDRVNKTVDFLTIFVNFVVKDDSFFESDIRLDLVQKLHVKTNQIYDGFPDGRSSRKKRAARTDELYLWKHNTVYYKIDKGFSKYFSNFLRVFDSISSVHFRLK